MEKNVNSELKYFWSIKFTRILEAPTSFEGVKQLLKLLRSQSEVLKMF